ncbi:helix-turn-helix transcriptional regulator [Nonomuraea sp. SYSU D8015]|uniref:helix-turn-helix transcriptional regulator n=1 Tax=Nonomuraea sp. SYSU D8015 TaxID=2593644 RepID=UPI0016604697|nr:LuxR family transcriptional regulator [Nonomuraea sp. SYSU D8015]
MLFGRNAEQAGIDRMLGDVRNGRSRTLVIRGEAGIGKTALLNHAAATGHDMRILRGTGIEQEMELPFSGLHLLLRTVLDGVPALPLPQAEALRSAFGLSSSPAHDRFLVGMAVLTLLADLADERPLLCLVDDAHWLDHASAEALLFAARRLEAEGVALLFAARDDDRTFHAAGIEEMRLGRLDDAAAARMLATHAGDLPPQARDRVLREAQGNPLALVELPTMLADVRQNALDIGHVSASGRVLRAFEERVSSLPEATRTILLVAAADDTGRLELVLEASGRLGASVADVEPAEAARLVHLDHRRLVFRHPLVRSAAYRSAPLTRRLAAHHALAEALDGRAEDLDRRAWHLAAAATGPDEQAAAALERSAEQARTRGGHAAVAAAYERAAQLSPEPARRARRLLAAAQAALDAGRHDQAHDLADRASAELDDPLVLGQAARLRATIANAQGRPKVAHATLAEAADAIAARDGDTAAVMYFEAISAAFAATEFAAAAHTAHRAAALGPSVTGPAEHLLLAASGLARVTSEEPVKALDGLRDLIEGVRRHGDPATLQERARIAIFDLVTGDDNAAYERAAAIEHDCRAQGAIGVLPLALALLSRAQLFLGRHRDAHASAEEGLRIARDTLQHDEAAALLAGVMACLAAIEGDEERCVTLVDRIRDTGNASAKGMSFAALILLDLALGRYEDAVRLAEEHGAALPAGRLMLTLHRAPDLVEAAVRADRLDFARTTSVWLEQWAAQTGQPWTQAVSLRCRALLTPGEEAERHYSAAAQLHQQGDRPFEQARTELLYGEWLRRARRRSEARPHLRSAMEIFERLGARPWAERARAELRAAGERRSRTGPAQAAALDRLTAQELQIVRMAATGMTNREIAAHLFLSPRTVGYHLYKAYPKLGVASRGELARLPLDEASSRLP